MTHEGQLWNLLDASNALIIMIKLFRTRSTVFRLFIVYMVWALIAGWEPIFLFLEHGSEVRKTVHSAPPTVPKIPHYLSTCCRQQKLSCNHELN